MLRTLAGLLAFSAVLSLPAATLAADEDHEHDHVTPPGTEAVCVLSAMKNSGVAGTILLTQQEGLVHVTGEITGLKPGEHGFHIHMFGDLRAADGTSAGGHYNPEGHPHGGPDSRERHAGDLGNIKADAKGIAKVDAKVKGLSVHKVLGRALVVHADPDDLKSQPAGNAGPRIGVGVIGLAEVKEAKK